MIPVCRPSIAGHYLRRVVLVRGDPITAPDPAAMAPSVRIRLYVCNGTRKDLIGTFDSARHKMDAMGHFSLTGSTDLNRKINVGEVVAVDAERFGYGAPKLTGFGVWVDTYFEGA